jgi:hypothetical protein
VGSTRDDPANLSLQNPRSHPQYTHPPWTRRFTISRNACAFSSSSRPNCEFEPLSSANAPAVTQLSVGRRPASEIMRRLVNDVEDAHSREIITPWQIIC